MVFITDSWLLDLTRSYVETRALVAVTHDRLLFNRGGRPLTTASVRTRLARAAQLAGISQKVTPHMLRHTAATQLIESGVGIRYVQRLLGHASLATTELYTHVSNPSLRRVVTEAAVLGRLLV